MSHVIECIRRTGTVCTSAKLWIDYSLGKPCILGILVEEMGGKTSKSSWEGTGKVNWNDLRHKENKKA